MIGTNGVFIVAPFGMVLRTDFFNSLFITVIDPDTNSYESWSVCML
jgi:hypothetical protein